MGLEEARVQQMVQENMEEGDSMKKEPTQNEKAKAQRKYCKDTKQPLFAPRWGTCWRCHKNIYDRISMEKASSEMITGCPHCHYSFCE